MVLLLLLGVLLGALLVLRVGAERPEAADSVAVVLFLVLGVRYDVDTDMKPEHPPPFWCDGGVIGRGRGNFVIVYYIVIPGGD